jgi:hypothetical protein
VELISEEEEDDKSEDDEEDVEDVFDDFMELELLMSEDSVDEKDDFRLDDCTLEVESSQRHSSIVMILTDDEILPPEMTEGMGDELESLEDEKVEEDSSEDEKDDNPGDEELILEDEEENSEVE